MLLLVNLELQINKEASYWGICIGANNNVKITNAMYKFKQLPAVNDFQHCKLLQNISA